MKILLNGRGGKVGTVLAPALDRAGHELVDGLEGADAMIDFTAPEAVLRNVQGAIAAGVPSVVGTSGWDTDAVRDAPVAVFYAPNFAVGAVLMMRFAEEAARHLPSAEIVELHHDEKIDAPSGTAMLTVARMAEASSSWGTDPTEKLVVEGARGALVDGIAVHSLRLRGLVAHQEVILGTTGQSLIIRHDSYDRSSFMPGVLLACKQVGTRPGLTIGLDALLDI